MRLSDTIEEFIKNLMLVAENEIQLQRNELAEYFGCAPSQINYVLSTRFTPDHGYITKSKRGGGGCILIYRIDDENTEQLRFLINERINNSITRNDAYNIVSQLRNRGIIDIKEENLIKAALSYNAFTIPIPEGLKNELRAKILKEILIEISLKKEEQEK